MNTLRRPTPILLFMAIAWLFDRSSAAAQSAQGPIVSGVLSATAIDSETGLSFSVSGGYRFNGAFGLGVEFSSAPSIEADASRFAALTRPVGFGGIDGELTTFTTNIRLEVPTTSSRFVPYAVAGGGVANLKRDVGFIILATEIPRPSELGLSIFPPPSCCSYALSTTSLALTLGGGLSVLAGEHVSIDVDLRYLRLLDNVDRNIGRFGAGASYRF